MTLTPKLLRESPQLATLELLSSSLTTAVLTLYAAHPALELDSEGPLPRLPIDLLAERVLEAAAPLLGAIDNYHRLMESLTRLGQGDLLNGINHAQF